MTAADDSFVMRHPPDADDDWRAWAILTRAGSSEWLLDIATRTGYDGQGHGKALIGEIREWADEHGYTVRTRNAMPDVYGFYEKCCCRKIADDEGDVEYLVAPVGACH